MCNTPFTVKDQNKIHSLVPCGICSICKSRRVSAWSFRLQQEDKISISSQFVTLTYDTKNINFTRRGFTTLSKRDLQLFFKRLRIAHVRTKKSDSGNNSSSTGNNERLGIRYYACGEYGSKSKRPHYHIILFNADSSLIPSCWDKGSIHVGNVTGASIGYSLKYISKGRTVPAHRNDDREPEFQLMSKGLGKNYVNEKTIKWHNEDKENRYYLTLEGGKKATMPRYYKERIYNSEAKGIIKGHFEKEAEKKAIDHVTKKGYIAREKKRSAAINAAETNYSKKHSKTEKL